MEVSLRNNGSHDFNLASRKAEEAAMRRYESVDWLESIVGPLHLSKQPSERDFISCLRNGLLLCNLMNKIHPGLVPKVVENNTSNLQSEFQPPPAFQHFENVRNFLKALKELNLPAFEASDLEKDTVDAGSVAKVVDCVLGLKSYHECRQMNIANGGGLIKPLRSPMVNNKIHARGSSKSSRNLDISLNGDLQDVQDMIVKALADYMVDTKENLDENLLRNKNLDSGKMFFNKIISSLTDEKFKSKYPELHSIFKDSLKQNSTSAVQSTSKPLEELHVQQKSQNSRGYMGKGDSSHRSLLQKQEKEVTDLKALLAKTKKEYEDLQFHIRTSFIEIGNQVLGMSAAASGYHKAVVENRKLYNMVQDLKGSIRVYCRTRPTSNDQTKSVIDFIGDDGSLVISDPSKPHKDGRKKFQFNHVFGPKATQGDVYKETQPLIRSVMDGYNVCIFAYGQTGSGKTYTMSGPSGTSTAEMGLNYLALDDLFLICEKRKGVMTYSIQVQMVEIYNEQVRDLLAESSSAIKLEIRTCHSEDGVSLPDATMRAVESTSDILSLMELGETNRAVSFTAMNDRSSRSHSIVTVHVRGKDKSGGTIGSCLHLVDLAGSERVDKSEVTGDRLKEALYINKSLSCLGDVISALALKNSHIPYRNSKLTLLLQDSLGGHAKTLMFAHLSPEEDSIHETMSTLKFAQRVSTVELGAASANKQSSEVMELKEQIESLKKTLANKDAQNNTRELRSSTAVIDRTPPRPRRLSIENKEAQNGLSNNSKELRSSRAMTNRTPPRTRRLSIENKQAQNGFSNLSKEVRSSMATTNRTPPRARRLSIENKEAQNGFSNKMKEIRSPVTSNDRTPGARRLSIENSTIKQHNGIHSEIRSGSKTPFVTTRGRRLSLEGPSNVKKNVEANPLGDLANMGSTVEASGVESPRSPTNSYQKPYGEMDGRPQAVPFQLQKTPERERVATNINSILTSADSRTTKGKESNIRKSLRSTIGKLINGSEKRNQQKSPIRNANNINDVKSPVTANARTPRRQSLTGSNPPSRRSSLEGRPPTHSANLRRNAKTPPPAHRSSAKTSKGWL